MKLKQLTVRSIVARMILKMFDCFPHFVIFVMFLKNFIIIFVIFKNFIA